MVILNNGVPSQPKNERELRRAFQKLRESQQSGGQFLVPFTTGATVSGHKVLYASGGTVLTADHATTPPDTVVGISSQSVLSGGTVQVWVGGKATGFSGLTPGAVYFLGSSGAITSTAPTSGIVQVIGVAQDASTLIVNIGPAFVLS